MAMTETVAVVDRDDESYVRWRPVLAGALVAAALTFVFVAFQAAVGLATASPAPSWRDASIALWVLSGFYAILVALLSFGLGGYVAGRMRTGLASGAGPDDVEFRDGMHGVLAWALATLIGAILALALAQAATRLAAPSGGSAGSGTTVAAENSVAYELDQLFRAERRPPDVDMTYSRAEAGRILLTAAGHNGVSPEDRTYLNRLVASRTGLAAPEAEARASTVIARVRESLRRARATGVIVGFMTAAALLVGAAAAWFGACAGGRQRDTGALPRMGTWSPTRLWT
jgi:hypothetical protein